MKKCLHGHVLCLEPMCQPKPKIQDPMGALEGILWLRDRLGSVSWGKNDCQVSCETGGTRHYATGKTFVDAVYKLREAVS